MICPKVQTETFMIISEARIVRCMVMGWWMMQTWLYVEIGEQQGLTGGPGK
jgi:hypothetical protein